MIVRAKTAGKFFGAHLPMTKEAYKDQKMREYVEKDIKQYLVGSIERLLFENQSIIGPKRKLPV